MSTARKLRDSVLRREIVIAMVEKARDKHEIVMGITSFAIELPDAIHATRPLVGNIFTTRKICPLLRR